MNSAHSVWVIGRSSKRILVASQKPYEETNHHHEAYHRVERPSVHRAGSGGAPEQTASHHPSDPRSGQVAMSDIDLPTPYSPDSHR